MSIKFERECAIREEKNHLSLNIAFVYWLGDLVPVENDKRSAFNKQAHNITIT
jgi:hypothetical protein